MLPAWRPQLSFRGSARRSCSLRVDFLVILEFSIRSGFRELKNTDFKPKGPARILVRAIAAAPTRTRSLNSPFQALHTRIVLRDAEARPGRPRLISPNRGQWDMELVERIAPAAIHRSPACGMRIRNKGDPQLDGTFISWNESSALPDVVRSAAGVSTTVWFAAPGLQTSVPTTLVSVRVRRWRFRRSAPSLRRRKRLRPWSG